MQYKKGCGGSCLRCWRNNLKHNNKIAKRHAAASSDTKWEIEGDIIEYSYKERRPQDTRKTEPYWLSRIDVQRLAAYAETICERRRYQRILIQDANKLSRRIKT